MSESQERIVDYPVYRVGRHNPALVYRQAYRGAAEALVAVFVERGGDPDPEARHYVRAMNATMPGCTCRIVCCCGALVGTTPGCETCAEHNVECVGGEE